MSGSSSGRSPGIDHPLLRKQVELGEPVPLYAFVNRRHTELAPRLAATLRQMKAEGLIEQYRHETLRKFGKE